LQTALRTVEELQAQYSVLAGQLVESEKARREERMESKLENEQLSDSLKEAESQIQSLEITVFIFNP
jgi:seryl-tRNA synthetase